MYSDECNKHHGAIDIGCDHSIDFVCWKPDRNLNPQYDSIPDIERAGASIYHKSIDGTECCGFITLDTPDARRVFPKHKVWTVDQEDPLTINPSIMCLRCGDHGSIFQGKWVKA